MSQAGLPRELFEGVTERAQWRGDGVDESLNVTGRRPNDAAFVFAVNCAHTWREVTGRPPPKRAHPDSPFMRFVVAALPAGLKPDSGGAMTGQVRRAMEHYHHRWTGAPSRPAEGSDSGPVRRRARDH